ncbi:MAG: hypothetical protein ABSA93_28725 [Streptosporangiaceae bacterium]
MSISRIDWVAASMTDVFSPRRAQTDSGMGAGTGRSDRFTRPSGSCPALAIRPTPRPARTAARNPARCAASHTTLAAIRCAARVSSARRRSAHGSSIATSGSV